MWRGPQCGPPPARAPPCFAPRPAPRAAGARATRQQGNLVVGGIPDQGADIFLVAGRPHPERTHLEETGIGAVKGTGDVVKEDVAADDPFEIVADAALVSDRLAEVGH